MNQTEELFCRVDKRVKQAQLTNCIENEVGNLVDFELILYPVSKEVPSFMYIHAVRRPIECITSSEWTRDEAEQLRKMLNSVLDTHELD